MYHTAGAPLAAADWLPTHETTLDPPSYVFALFNITKKIRKFYANLLFPEFEQLCLIEIVKKNVQ